MTETSNLSNNEVKEILAIFFDIPLSKISFWNMRWMFEADGEYIKNKIKQRQNQFDAEHKEEKAE